MKTKIAKKYGRWVLITEVVLISAFFIVLYNFYLPLGGKKTSIYADGNLTRTLKTLRFVGFDINDLDERLAPWLVLPETGWYRIEPHAKGGRVGFFSSLFAHPSSLMRLRIYGGDGVGDILQRLANDTKLPLSKLQRAYADANLSEGDLLAGTYIVARDADARSLINALANISRRRAESVFIESGWGIPDERSRRILYTVASIIQKETRRKEEMPLIASVIYNRLASDMKLQMDGTLNYGPYSHTPVTPERIRNDHTPYNTYRYKGLPPAPLSAFSPEALRAAIIPATTNYLYFMLEHDGKHAFSTEYSDHLRYLRAFKKSLTRRKTNR
jgi:UPF0755 protein